MGRGVIGRELGVPPALAGNSEEHSLSRSPGGIFLRKCGRRQGRGLERYSKCTSNAFDLKELFGRAPTAPLCNIESYQLWHNLGGEKKTEATETGPRASGTFPIAPTNKRIAVSRETKGLC